MSLHGSRALVENLSDVELHDLTIEVGGSPASDVLEYISEQLTLKGNKLLAKQRTVIPLGRRVILDKAVPLFVKYTSERWGRERQRIVLIPSVSDDSSQQTDRSEKSIIHDHEAE
jgi:hypothetical protein